MDFKGFDTEGVLVQLVCYGFVCYGTLVPEEILFCMIMLIVNATVEKIAIITRRLGLFSLLEIQTPVP